MIVVDTSVAVAAAAPWHEHHALALGALPAQRTRLLAHVAVETYSVLTRLPPPLRVPPTAARGYLVRSFATPALTLPAGRYERVLDLAAERGVLGGAVYDLLVAATASAAEATLLSLDARAAQTYRMVDVDHRLLR